MRSTRADRPATTAAKRNSRSCSGTLNTASGDSIGAGAGVANVPFAAEFAARRDLIVEPGGSAGFLAPLPLRVLEPGLARVLLTLGIRTVGQFAALPTDAVGNRFGMDGVLAHRLARGLDPRPGRAAPGGTWSRSTS